MHVLYFIQHVNSGRAGVRGAFACMFYTSHKLGAGGGPRGLCMHVLYFIQHVNARRAGLRGAFACMFYTSYNM